MLPNTIEGEFDVLTRIQQPLWSSEPANQWWGAKLYCSKKYFMTKFISIVRILTKENQRNGREGNGELEDGAWRGSFEGLSSSRDSSIERQTTNTKDETASIDSELSFWQIDHDDLWTFNLVIKLCSLDSLRRLHSFYIHTLIIRIDYNLEFINKELNCLRLHEIKVIQKL